MDANPLAGPGGIIIIVIIIVIIIISSSSSSSIVICIVICIIVITIIVIIIIVVMIAILEVLPTGPSARCSSSRPASALRLRRVIASSSYHIIISYNMYY